MREAAYNYALAELAESEFSDGERERLARAFSEHVAGVVTKHEISGESYRVLADAMGVEAQEVMSQAIEGSWGSFVAGLAAAIPPPEVH